MENFIIVRQRLDLDGNTLSLQYVHFQMTYGITSYSENFVLKANLNLTTRERDDAQFNGEALAETLAPRLC